MKKLLISLLFVLLLNITGIQPTFATIIGVYRESTYHIFDDGHFTYEATIKIYNDQSTARKYEGTWHFYTDDFNKIKVENIQWEGPFEAYSGDDPFQPDIKRNGYKRKHSITVKGFSYYTYKIFYEGPTVYWGFNNNQGTFYGDGFGGAETPFKDFFVNVILPDNATSFNIIKESSPYILISSKPIHLRWIEHNVEGVIDNLIFSGDELTTSKPVIKVNWLNPLQPTIYDNLLFQGIIQFPDGRTYNPGAGAFAVEDPWKQQTTLIAINQDGTFTYSTANIANQPGGFPLFRFILNYEGELISNYFNLYADESEDIYDFFADIRFEMSLFNHNSSFPATTDAFVYRSNDTPPTKLDLAMDAGAAAAKNFWSYTRSVGKEYWSSPINITLFIGTGLACGSNLIFPNPISLASCVWGVKTNIISLTKSNFFVAFDKIIDMIPNEKWDKNQKQAAKMLFRTNTHLITFFIQPHKGGIRYIRDLSLLITKLVELKVKSTHLILEEDNAQTFLLDGYIIQCVDQDDEIWNIGVGRIEPNGLCFRGNSHIDIKVTDPQGKVVQKGRSDIPGSHYFEFDINGDGFNDDEIFIPGYSLGGYRLEVIPEKNISPNDLVTLTVNGSWLDTTFVFAQNVRIEDLKPEGYSILPERRSISGKFWFKQDTLFYGATGSIDGYLEVPNGYDLSLIRTNNTLLNHRLQPSIIDNVNTDINFNGIAERHLIFDMKSISHLMDENPEALAGIFNLQVDYRSVTQIISIDTVFTFSGMSLAVISPNIKEAWQIGTSKLITWKASGVDGKVNIALSTNSGQDWEKIGEILAQTGQMNWTVPDKESYHCRIQVSSLTNSSLLDVSDTDFYIVPAKNRLSVSNEKVNPGVTSCKVEIALTNDRPISGIQFDIVESPDVLIFRQAVLTSRTTNFAQSAVERTSDMRVMLYDLSARTIAAGFGPVLELHYDIPAGITPGTLINLNLQNVTIADAQANILPVESRNGTILIKKTAAVESNPTFPPSDYEIQVLPAYPNPFKAKIQFTYRLEKPLPVQIKIYNLLGQEVVDLMNQQQPAGDHTIFWDGFGQDEKQVLRGIYLVQIKAGRTQKIQKILFTP
ncbi:T9SS type A sorting domain-containing protein [candidate division KSB1 bacterium]|nr:T9SS type A sorting domain-containing protein [candidate division KSB1 bacterium]